MKLMIFVGIFLTVLSACGGGGSSSAPNPPPPAPPPQSLTVVDANPGDQANNADPGIAYASAAHTGFSGLAYTQAASSGCDSLLSVRRTTRDLSDAAAEELVDHRFDCDALGINNSVSLQLDAVGNNGTEFVLNHPFSTGSGVPAGLVVLDGIGTSQAAVEQVFTDYIASELLAQLELPVAAQVLIAANLATLASSWTQLQSPAAVHNVTAQRVSYRTRDPNGDASDQVTGLVVWPDVPNGFVAKDRVVVLSHATGSTPSELDVTNAWYLTGLILASRGYLVIAPDNWGRGGTQAEPETYLLANRTAANTIDLVREVLNDATFAPLLASAPAELALVGYSQGGHSALATWLAMTIHSFTEFNVAEVYAGAGPYDLYATFRGVVEYLDGNCGGGEFCQFVDDETTVPFATDRILPGLLGYTQTELAASDVIDGATLNAQFVSDFITDAPRIDALKTLLQLSSITNVTNGAEVFSGSNTDFLLYHSNFDRLVPVANEDRLDALLSAQHAVQRRGDLCNTTTYQAIFNAVDIVGVVHALCGFAMIDDVLAELD